MGLIPITMRVLPDPPANQHKTMIRNKTWSMLTDEEIEKEAKLTPKEQAAVDAFVAAAKALPRSLCIDKSDYENEDDGLTVSKRITPNMTQVVAHIRKRSLLGL